VDVVGSSFIRRFFQEEEKALIMRRNELICFAQKTLFESEKLRFC